MTMMVLLVAMRRALRRKENAGSLFDFLDTNLLTIRRRRRGGRRRLIYTFQGPSVHRHFFRPSRSGIACAAAHQDSRVAANPTPTDGGIIVFVVIRPGGGRLISDRSHGAAALDQVGQILRQATTRHCLLVAAFGVVEVVLALCCCVR